MGIKLSKADKEVALDLVSHLEVGAITIPQILDLFKKDKQVCEAILYFWVNHSKRTQDVVNELFLYKARQHLQKCLEKEY